MCVSTGNAGSPNACAITTLAVLWPTPGSVLERGEVARHLAAVLGDERRVLIAARFFALLGARPQRADERQDLRARVSFAIAAASGARANSAGVTRLTRASVHCADSTTATSSWNGSP